MGFTATDSRMVIVNVIEYPSVAVDSFNFPRSAVVGEWKPFSIKGKVTKAGAGKIAVGINNAVGSAGSIVIRYGGKEYTIRPNENFVSEDGGADYVGKTYEISGSIKFTSSGEYTITIFAGYSI